LRKRHSPNFPGVRSNRPECNTSSTRTARQRRLVRKRFADVGPYALRCATIRSSTIARVRDDELDLARVREGVVLGAAIVVISHHFR
jgi:hypothetical protein